MEPNKGNSNMETGTSEQVLNSSKQKKRNAYIAGGVVMAIVIALVIAAVVLLSGNIGGETDEIIGTTEGPTTIPPVITEPTSPITEATTEPVTEPVTEPATEPIPEETTEAVTEAPEDNPISLEELNDGAFSPSSFSGTWVSGTEFLYKDDDNNVILHNAVTGTYTVLLSNTSAILSEDSASSVQRSPDATSVVVASGAQSVYRHSILARYTGVTLATGAEVSIGPVGVADPYLQNFLWGPTGTSLAFVYLNNVYYKPSLTADAQQISTNGVLNIVYNGIPDWVYEEEVFGSAIAMWISPEGGHLAYASFDDTNVRVMPVPHYGTPGSVEDQYTRHDAIRYPKAGTTNPTVSMTIFNIATSVATTYQPPTTLDHWYKATHELDSAQQHLYRASSDQVTCFTCDIQHSSGVSCLYNDAVLSADQSVATITCGGPALPEVYIYNTNGDRLSVWEDNAAVSSLLEDRALPATTRLSVPVQDGLPDAQVFIQHPQDVDTRTNVPLLVYVYAGPDSGQVTHSWLLDWGTTLVSRWGIAVAYIDGRGSGLKGVENLFALNRRLGTDEIDDQISVTRYLQENLSYIDSNRTCIWGWSYGGYASTLALVRGGDVFRCAMAVAPVTDWRYYDTIYTERYLDTPANNPEGYTNSSLLNEEAVDGIHGKSYFLVHGTADDNVHYQQAMLLSRILQVNDVYFDQMSYTDQDHGLGGVRPHLYHALEHFLQENML